MLNSEFFPVGKDNIVRLKGLRSSIESKQAVATKLDDEVLNSITDEDELFKEIEESGKTQDTLREESFAVSGSFCESLCLQNV